MKGEIDGDDGIIMADGWMRDKMSDRHMLVANQRSEVFGESQGDVTKGTWSILLYLTRLLE